MRTRTPINLTVEERLVQRAKIVLLAAEGLSNRNFGPPRSFPHEQVPHHLHDGQHRDEQAKVIEDKSPEQHFRASVEHGFLP